MDLHHLPSSYNLPELSFQSLSGRLLGYLSSSPYFRAFPTPATHGRYYGCEATLKKLREQSGCDFIIHDVRRSFLTMAERLGTPHYALKKLAGHSMGEDITGAYLVIDVERLREPMQRITDRFLELMELAPLGETKTHSECCQTIPDYFLTDVAAS